MAQGYRFAQTGIPQVGGDGSIAGSFALDGAVRQGRGPGAPMPTFGTQGQKFSAGQGGVETYPGCYGLPTYCGWQQVAGAIIELDGTTPGVVSVLPTVSPYFEPKAVYLFGIDPNAPGTNLRFTVGAVTVGGSPQLAINNLAPAAGSTEVLLSDVFNRSDEPLLCNWSVFSTSGLARELQVNLFNLNAGELNVYACVWGNAVSSLDCYA